MKKILIILMLTGFYQTQAFSQNDLYLIFDINTPPVTKDITKYILLRSGDVRVREMKVSKINTYLYYYTYPLLAGDCLTFSKKTGTTPQILPMSALASYPSAKTIGQLDTEIQPLIDLDYTDPGKGRFHELELRTYQYFVNIDNFYIIELDHTNNQIIVVECILNLGRY